MQAFAARSATAISAELVEEQLPWGIEAEVLAPGCRIYRITRQAASGVSKEATEYNIWAAQLSKLSHVPITQIAQVDRIVYGPDSPVIQAYINKKRELGAAGRGLDAEQYVFHGTGTEQALRSIATNGFIVGGSVAGVPVLNGTAYGAGVYTAIGPTTPMGYGIGTGKVVLAKTMPGLNNVHSTRPNGDWIVFKDAALLLPLAIITFGPPSIAGMAAGIAVPPAFAQSIARAQAAHQAAAQAAAAFQAAAAAAAAKAAAEAVKRAAALQEEKELEETLTLSLVHSAATEARLAHEREDERRAIKASLRETSPYRAGRGAEAGLSQDAGLDGFGGVIAYTDEERAIMASARTFREEEQRRLQHQGRAGSVVDIAAAAAGSRPGACYRPPSSSRKRASSRWPRTNPSFHDDDSDTEDDERALVVVDCVAAKRARQHDTQPQPQPGRAVFDLTRDAVVYTIDDD